MLIEDPELIYSYGKEQEKELCIWNVMTDEQWYAFSMRGYYFCWQACRHT
jgi:hypothetical protein